MPGPPPPPPPGGMPPAPPAPMGIPKFPKPDDRGALLKSIQKGTRLKKAVTNDRSSPVIGKVSSNNNNNGSQGNSSTNSNGMNLGGLFAGGMPKLKPTGKFSPSSNHHNNGYTVDKKPEVPSSQPIKNASSLQNELRKQLASDNKNRGPPPPAPTRFINEENCIRQPLLPKVGSTNGLNFLQNAQPQNSTLHRKAKSNVNLNSYEQSEHVNGFHQINNKPIISHGKPNLAPKPPGIVKPAAPPKKLLLNGKPISRAHSMRSPRTPSPQSPDQPKFGTVRNLSSVLSQSIANSTGNLSPRPRPAINGRPNAPPPSIPTPQYPPPPSKTTVKPPNHAPPPPPSHTPPPPPQRMLPSRAPPAVPNYNGNGFAPPPPPRHSSMTSTRKTVLEFEEKFKFHDPSTFPKPPPYRNIFKVYGSRQVGNKQQAPQPPQSSRLTDSSTC